MLPDNSTFWDVVQVIFSQWVVRAVFGLLVANFASGLAVALKEGTFRLGAIMDWLAPTVYYLLGGLLVELLLWSLPADMAPLGGASSKVVWLAICAALSGKVLDNLKRLGVEVIPTALTDKAKPETAARP